MPNELTHERRVRLLSGISALLGLWLIASPWIVGAPGPSVANSGMAVGALILIASLVRFVLKRTVVLSWGMMLLGGWTMMSPWVLGQELGNFRTFNYVVVGLLVVVMGAYSLTSSATQPNWRQRETGRR
jgi:hypothetical protein